MANKKALSKQQLFDKVLDKVSEEGFSVRQACKEVGMNRRVFYELLNEENEEATERQNRYARACEERQEKILDELFEIADDSTHDTMITDKGQEKVNKEWVDRSKLRVDVRKWALSKMNPKKYGDKASLDVDVRERVTIQLDLGSDSEDED